MKSFSGVYTALITPFSGDGSSIDFDRLKANVADQAAGDVQGVVPCGTTGEAPTLNDQEHKAVLERVTGWAHEHGLTSIAGAGSNDTTHAITLHMFARSINADASLQVCPYYNKPCQEGLYRHFMTVAESCDLPIVLYNIPGRSGVGLTIETIRRLAEHPNIQAIKEATGTVKMAGDVLASTNLAVLSGDDPLTLPMMSLGASGVVSVMSNLVPGQLSSMLRHIQAGDFTSARTLHYRLLPLAEALLQTAPNPVPIKLALQLLGRDTGSVRLPLVDAPVEVREALGDVMQKLELIPLAQQAV